MPVSTSNAPGEPNKYSLLARGAISKVSDNTIQNVTSFNTLQDIGNGYIKVTINFTQNGAAGACTAACGTASGGSEVTGTAAAATSLSSEFYFFKNAGTPANIDGKVCNYSNVATTNSIFNNAAGSFNFSAAEEVFIGVKCVTMGATIAGNWVAEWFKA